MLSLSWYILLPCLLGLINDSRVQRHGREQHVKLSTGRKGVLKQRLHKE